MTCSPESPGRSVVGAGLEDEGEGVELGLGDAVAVVVLEVDDFEVERLGVGELDVDGVEVDELAVADVDVERGVEVLDVAEADPESEVDGESDVERRDEEVEEAAEVGLDVDAVCAGRLVASDAWPSSLCPVPQADTAMVMVARPATVATPKRPLGWTVMRLSC
ncbi:hypothetical protein GCM10022199_13190 [Marihabitans asiaticum]|uniref:hypothetical protein n=1 Tax=Marihabitans asiaticum TaxID=415218 RepID=UPI001FED0C76|nr:hypothetical protein [Marihabitans asiaticum]